MHLPIDRAGLHIERGEQRGGAVALVVVGAPLDLTGPHRQQRLRAIQRLNLRLSRRRTAPGRARAAEIQPHDIAHLLDEQRIGRQLERLGAMRLQAEGAPDPLHRRGIIGNLLGMALERPVRASVGACFERLADRSTRIVVTDLARRIRVEARRRVRPFGARQIGCAMCRLSLRRRRPWPRSLCC